MLIFLKKLKIYVIVQRFCKTVIKIITAKSIIIFFPNFICFSDNIEPILFPAIQISIAYIIIKITTTRTEKLINCFKITQEINNEQKATNTSKSAIIFKINAILFIILFSDLT